MIAEAILYIYIYNYFRYIDIWVHVVIYNVISYGFHFHIFQWDDPWPSSHQGLSRGCSDIAVEAAPSAAPCVAMSNEAQMREPYWILTCPIPKPNLRPLWRIFLAAADDVESKMHGSCWWSCGKIRVPVTSHPIAFYRSEPLCVCKFTRVCWWHSARYLKRKCREVPLLKLLTAPQVPQPLQVLQVLQVPQEPQVELMAKCACQRQQSARQIDVYLESISFSIINHHLPFRPFSWLARAFVFACFASVCIT